MDELVNSLAFEIETIPQENAIKINSSSNIAPVSMKIRVRQKPNAGVHNTAICISKYDYFSNAREELRGASSDQTIMSFDMLMEADLEKPVCKPKKYLFRRCLGSQYDDDDNSNPYMPNATRDTATSRYDSGVMKKNIKLSKNIVCTDGPQIVDKKQKKFFGMCKPGGCLDPPYGEDKYSYQPKKESNTYRTHEEYDTDKQPCTPYKEINNNTTTKLKNKSIATREKKLDSLSNNVLNVYQMKATKTLLDDNDSDSIITYPPVLSYSGLNINDEWLEKCAKSNRSSSASKARNSYSEFSPSYFTPKDASITKVRVKRGSKIEKYDKPTEIQTETTELFDTMDRQKDEDTSILIDKIKTELYSERVRNIKETDAVKDSGIEVNYKKCNDNKNVTLQKIQNQTEETLENSRQINIEEKSKTSSVNNYVSTEKIATLIYTKSNSLKDTETFEMRAEKYCGDINKTITSFEDENILLENKQTIISDTHSKHEYVPTLSRIDDKNISTGAGTTLNIDDQSSVSKETDLQQGWSSTIDNMRQSQGKDFTITEVIYKQSNKSNEESKVMSEDGNGIIGSDINHSINLSHENGNTRKQLSSTKKNLVESTEPQSLITETKLNKSDSSIVATDIRQSKIDKMLITTKETSSNFPKEGCDEDNEHNIFNLPQLKLVTNVDNVETLSLIILPELDDQISTSKPPLSSLDIVTDICDQFTAKNYYDCNNVNFKINISASDIISQVSSIHVPPPAKSVSLNKELDIPQSEQLDMATNKIFASKNDTPKGITELNIPTIDRRNTKIEGDKENQDGNNLFLSDLFSKLDIEEQKHRTSLYNYTNNQVSTPTETELSPKGKTDLPSNTAQFTISSKHDNKDNNPFSNVSFTHQYGENNFIKALNIQGDQISTDTKIELLDTLNSYVKEYRGSASYNEQLNILFEGIDVHQDEYISINTQPELVQKKNPENDIQSKDQYRSDEYYKKDEHTPVNTAKSFHKPHIVEQTKEVIFKEHDFPQQDLIKTTTETESSDSLVDDVAPNYKTELQTIITPTIVSSELPKNDSLLHVTKSQSKEKIEQQPRRVIFNEGLSFYGDKQIYSYSNIKLFYNSKKDLPKVETSFQRMRNITNEEDIHNDSLSSVTETQLIQKSHSEDLTIENTSKGFKNEVMTSESIDEVKSSQELPENILNSLKSNRQAFISSTKISSPAPSVILDMVFRIYRNDNKERVITTLEVGYANQHPNLDVIVLKSRVSPNGGKIAFPIDAETDMTIKIKTGTSNGKCYSKKIESVLPNYQTQWDCSANVPYLKIEDYGRDNTAKYPHKLVSHKIRHDVLLASIYEQELVPLKNLIKSLKEDIDALSRQPILIKDILLCDRKKPVRLIRSNRRCGCIGK